MGRAVARLADRHGARRAALCGILANIALYTAFIPTAVAAIERTNGELSTGQTLGGVAGPSLAARCSPRTALALSTSGFLSNVFAGCYSAVLPLYLLKVVQLPPQVYGLNSTISLLLACTAFYGIGLRGWNSSTSSSLLRSAHGPGLHGITTMYRSIVFAGAPLGSGLGALMGSFSPAWGVFTAGVVTAACGCVSAVMAGGDVGARVHC
ncbi:hypothetical protein SAMN05216355_1082 [Actinomyces ruminicola]|uniref:Major Facilitator Superfamily protein n=1 Tax=Actinomyces ruminicola TaxID=332524 RepID=A0A1H0CSC7_9ACTO|nr:hypothetical protein [Actinomyces ruminicola]SDN60764.1 hypothetical protein SAMN05216355_1082 [Actinomyces ruminicola]